MMVVCRREGKHGKGPQQEAGELEATPPEDVEEEPRARGG
jgi:hypothetical protein